MRQFILIFILCLSGLFRANVPPLEREITITLNNEKLSTGLQKIQDQTGLIFSYQASIINNSNLLSLQITKKTVREALAMMLPKNIVYKAKNNYIILKVKPAEKNPAKTEISGYVYDEKTEERVPNVTIYDKNTLQSATTDEYGFYKMTVAGTTESISVNKENYKDTMIALSKTTDASIVNITIRQNSTFKKTDSLFWKNKISEVSEYGVMLFQKFKGHINSLNVKDTIFRKFQVSVIPFVGTNHRLSGSVYNRLSFNIYGGYARGLHGVEIGGLFNLEKENVKGFQAAGLFNVVGDSVKGTQIAGLINITGKASEGFQAAGLMNINEGSQKGFQAAGLMNINEKSTGTSAAGLMNICENVKGVQLAGLANLQDTLNGIAISGLFNMSDHQRNGSQLSGLFNKSQTGSTQLQVAGLFNSASYLKGFQISPFNYADSATGTPIGLLSFVKTGVHQMELSADEMFFTNISLRTGVNRFYNIVTVGLQPGTDLWQLGYGLGTSFKISEKMRSDLTATVHHVNKGGIYFSTSDLYRFYVGAEYRFGKKFSIAAGPTFNFYVTDTLDPDFSSTYKNITPTPLFSFVNPYDFSMKGWVGGKVSLRFF